MLFDKSIEPNCAYCRYGAAMGNDEIACSRWGIMAGSGFCGSFRYEPTKREPLLTPVVNGSGLSEEDFTL